MRPHPTRSVFVTQRGTRILPSNFSSREFKALTERSGLRCTFHQLRHTSATLMLGNGIDLKTVQDVLGHEKAEMTLDVYGDLIPANLDRAAVVLSDVLSKD